MLPTIWRAQCGVCYSSWKSDIMDHNPYPHGVFCPDCRERKLIAPGVLHFKPDEVDEYVAEMDIAKWP